VAVTRSTQVARTAAQLHEAAQEVARLAARRNGGQGVRFSGLRDNGGHWRGEAPGTHTTFDAPLARPSDSQGSNFLPAPLALLLKTARREIDGHTDDHGLCAICGCAFPCERAALADLALGGL
jgi:hypothetical protein